MQEEFYAFTCICRGAASTLMQHRDEVPHRKILYRQS